MSHTHRTVDEVRVALARRLHAAGDAPISGELLAGELGISRAAVSKHLAVLREHGFGIDASPRRGYTLRAWPDALTLEAVAPLLGTHALGRELQCHDVCDSTNDLAFRAGLGGSPHGLTVVADRQRAGRGRKGRSWHSPSGAGIYASVLLRPELTPQAAPPLTLVCAVAVAEALEQTLGIEAALKWPNDLLLGGRKVCGILLEMSAEPDRVAFVVCGIGLNVRTESFPPELAHRATSLASHTDRPLNRPRLLAALLAALERWSARYVDAGFPPVRDAWITRAAHLGQPVRVDTPAGERHGIAEGLDDDGALLLREETGARHRILAGDVWPRGLPVDSEAPTR